MLEPRLNRRRRGSRDEERVQPALQCDGSVSELRKGEGRNVVVSKTDQAEQMIGEHSDLRRRRRVRQHLLQESGDQLRRVASEAAHVEHAIGGRSLIELQLLEDDAQRWIRSERRAHRERAKSYGL